MTGSTADWERYERWNAAVAEVLFPLREHPTPVYLDVEDELLDALRDLAEPEAPDAQDALIDAVTGTLTLRHGPAAVLRGHINRLERWEEGARTDPPPTLGLLAVLSLVAERMHLGDGMAQHNYYGRVQEILGLDDEERRAFTTAYQRSSERLWTSLKDWLMALEGNRGLPTAEPIGHTHIGYPLSQALVRRADRDKFEEMFALFGLPPRAVLPPAEMASIIAEWMSRTPCPASNTLENLWGRDKDARERIVDVARATLESWDGADEAGMGTSPTPVVDTVRTVVRFRTFPRASIDVAIAVPGRIDVEEEEIHVLGPDGAPIATLALVSIASGWMTPADPLAVDTGSFLHGVTCLQRDGAAPIRRRARRLVPLRWDDMIRGYVETERVQLGDDCALLISNDILPVVEPVLEAVARPGYRTHRDLPGLPSGWTAIDGVQILSSIPPEMLHGKLVDLNLLQPRATEQLELHGGMSIPGNMRKWATGTPPELRVTADTESELSGTLTCTRPLASPAPTERTRSGAAGVLLWDLADENLPDGDYQITISSGDGEPVGSVTVRLRSADHPGLRMSFGAIAISHDPSEPGFGLLATGAGTGFQVVPERPRSDVSAASSESVGVPGWFTSRTGQQRAHARTTSVHIPGGDPNSCMVTGYHYWDVETAFAGMRSVEGVCRYCGMVKRFPTRARRKRAARQQPTAPQLDVARLDRVREAPTMNWSLGFDAVCQVGAGPISWLSRIANQMEPDSLFADVFLRRLEVLGHIEVERDPFTLRPVSWEVTDPVLLQLPDGTFQLAGFRSERAIACIEDEAYAVGGEVRITREIDAPPLINVVGVPADDLPRIAHAIEGASGRTCRSVSSPAWTLASHLPTLSEALTALPTTTAIGARRFERWDPTVARFSPSEDASKAGAYRLRGFGSTYVIRRPEDLGESRAVVGDARIVKYAAAQLTLQSLIGYDDGQQVLYVPLGADLPGLYGRAAVLASGRPPLENETERILEYHEVPADLAAHLAHLLAT